LRKHDLEIEEICCANDRFLSKMTPRLRAKSTGESMQIFALWKMLWPLKKIDDNEMK